MKLIMLFNIQLKEKSMKKILFTIALLIGLNSITFGFATMWQMYQGGDTINFSSNVNNVVVLQNLIII